MTYVECFALVGILVAFCFAIRFGPPHIQALTRRSAEGAFSLKHDAVYFGMAILLGLVPNWLFPELGLVPSCALMLGGIVIAMFVAQAFCGRKVEQAE